MINLLMLLSLSCHEPKMLNTSSFAWNQYDYSMLNRAKFRCEELYSDAPCVKLFKKWGKRDYSVICGVKK